MPAPFQICNWVLGPYNSARLSKKCVFHPDNLPLKDGKKRSSPPGVGEAYRITFGKEQEGAHYAEADEATMGEIIAAQPTLLTQDCW